MRRDRRTGRRQHCGPTDHCVTAASWIPALAGDDAADAPGPIRAHVSGCLRCQAEAARYRRMVRELRALQVQRLVPPEDALTHTLRALRDLEPARRPVAYVGGVVATAAGAAAGVGMLVWRSRRRALAG